MGQIRNTQHSEYKVKNEELKHTFTYLFTLRLCDHITQTRRTLRPSHFTAYRLVALSSSVARLVSLSVRECLFIVNSCIYLLHIKVADCVAVFFLRSFYERYTQTGSPWTWPRIERIRALTHTHTSILENCRLWNACECVLDECDFCFFLFGVRRGCCCCWCSAFIFLDGFAAFFLSFVPYYFHFIVSHSFSFDDYFPGVLLYEWVFMCVIRFFNSFFFAFHFRFSRLLFFLTLVMNWRLIFFSVAG